MSVGPAQLAEEPPASAASAQGDTPVPRLPPCAASGVDRAQIERMLDLDPVQRLRLLEDWIRGVEELRGILVAGGEVASVR